MNSQDSQEIEVILMAAEYGLACAKHLLANGSVEDAEIAVKQAQNFLSQIPD